MEEAVRRETWEETGIEVGEVIYHSSQPWPGIICLLHVSACGANLDIVEHIRCDSVCVCVCVP